MKLFPDMALSAKKNSKKKRITTILRGDKVLLLGRRVTFLEELKENYEFINEWGKIERMSKTVKPVKAYVAAKFEEC
jgi:hypothetical protein